jgi:uncharacterized protein HemX
MTIQSAVMQAEPSDNETTQTERTETTPEDTENALATGKKFLNEHKGKLAIGVAATLGLMIFYNWREKKLSEEDPESYAALKRVKDSLRAEEESLKQTDTHKKQYKKTSTETGTPPQ